LLSCCNCDKNKKFKYEILKTSNSKNLVFVDSGSDIFGIDTTTFTVEVHLRIPNMATGGVCQLPKGGIAFTHNCNLNNNKKGNELYVTDANYKMIDKYPICGNPMAPKVINNILMVGSASFAENGKMSFQLYNTNNFSLIQEYFFEDMIDAWKIAEYNTYA
jgi:hypothetical protein